MSRTMKTIKIGNVIFYKVGDTGNKSSDTWITHDGKYGVFRAYLSKRRSECVVAINKLEYATDPTVDDLNQYHLVADTKDKRIIFSNARSAMQYICEHYYWESRK